jgi:hypothetical protein
MKKLLCSLFLLIAVITAYCQENTEVIRYKNAIGLGAGFTTGYGLSYKHAPNKYGFMINFGPYFNDYGKESVISTGLTLIDKIRDAKYYNVYMYLANHYFYSRTADYTYYPPTTPQKYSINNSWNTGFGLGLEVDARKRVVLNVMVGYAQYNTFEKLFFTGELALHYRFN